MRALATIETKNIQERERRISGIATSPRIDRLGDIVDPAGITAAADIPLLLHHDSTQVIGRAKLLPATPRGMPFEATIPRVSEAGKLRDRIDEAWSMLKHGLLKGVSIGFRPLESELLHSGGIRYIKTEILELSLVAVPANSDATVGALKANRAERAALIQRLRSTRSAATYDPAAFRRQVAQEYASDPQLRAQRDRRMGRPDATAAALFGLD